MSLRFAGTMRIEGDARVKFSEPHIDGQDELVNVGLGPGCLCLGHLRGPVRRGAKLTKCAYSHEPDARHLWTRIELLLVHPC